MAIVGNDTLKSEDGQLIIQNYAQTEDGPGSRYGFLYKGKQEAVMTEIQNIPGQYSYFLHSDRDMIGDVMENVTLLAIKEESSKKIWQQEPLCKTCRNALDFPQCCTENLSDSIKVITNCVNYDSMKIHKINTEVMNMGKRIEDPFSWDRHETEALLACDGTKELTAVVIVKAEGQPEAFYRVKEAGEVPADFTNWLEAVDYYNCIESRQNEQRERVAVAKRELQDEDWKTAIVRNKEPIPAGAEVEIIGTLQNMYGDFLKVKYNDTSYTVKPEDIEQ